MRHQIICFVLGSCFLLVTRSSTVEDKELVSQNADKLHNAMPFIFPGTKWCGSGDLAKSFDDLGFHKDTDMCCRTHDVCNDTMAPGQTKNGLTNDNAFTLLSCKCDNDFYDCLEKVNSMTSNTVGKMYFNILKSKCYAEDYPLTNKCKKYKTFLKLICVEYHRDTSAEKVYQLFDAKYYKKLPIPIGRR